ncbi:MAG: CBS domain-containing protein [Leptolyngbya sp. SIO1E4]|nr:CBS domain-containing protein [Leptolyngbya sp. SIO1E4]
MLIVKDIMTKPVVVIRNTATVENAILLLRAKRVRSLIVEKRHNDDTYGILTDKDIVYKVIAPGANPAFVQVDAIMRHPCIQVPASITVQEAAQIFADAGIHRAPVIEQNQLWGIVSVTDILTKGSLVDPPRDELSRRIQAALQHARIIDDEEAQMQQECDIAWQIFEDMCLTPHPL